jgi:serine O-acetyltransferase
MIREIEQDLLANGAPSTVPRQMLKFFWIHPGFSAAVYYRIYARWYPKGGIKRAIARILWLRVVRTTGCYISPLAHIGPGLELRHATAIVIGDGVTIGRRAAIYQNVTIGTRGGNEYPVLGDNVTVYAGACVLGRVRIGNNAVIGANAVVLDDVPDNGVAVGAPARVVRTEMRQAS